MPTTTTTLVLAQSLKVMLTLGLVLATLRVSF